MLTILLVFFAPPIALLVIAYLLYRRRGSVGDRSPHADFSMDQTVTGEQLRSGPIHENLRR
jgi:hypothetical protein